MYDELIFYDSIYAVHHVWIEVNRSSDRWLLFLFIFLFVIWRTLPTKLDVLMLALEGLQASPLTQAAGASTTKRGRLRFFWNVG